MMSKKRISRCVYLLLAVFLPHVLLVSGQPKLLYMLDLVGVYAILAIAINLLVGFTGQISLGHAAFMAIGAYTSTLCTLKLHLPIPIGIILAGGISGLLGYLLGLPALRMKGHYLAILTLAFGFIVPGVIARMEGLTGGFIGLHSNKFRYLDFLFDYLDKGSVTDGSAYYTVFLVLAAIYLFSSNLLSSRTGRAFVALQGHESAARTLGIHITKYKTLAFFYSTFFAGIAGALYAHLVGYIEPKGFDLWMSFTPLIMIFVGGIASVPGSVIGAFFIIMFPELVRLFTNIPDMPNILLAIFLIVVLIFLPNGFISVKASKLYLSLALFIKNLSGRNGKIA